MGTPNNSTLVHPPLSTWHQYYTATLCWAQLVLLLPVLLIQPVPATLCFAARTAHVDSTSYPVSLDVAEQQWPVLLMLPVPVAPLLL